MSEKPPPLVDRLSQEVRELRITVDSLERVIHDLQQALQALQNDHR